MRILKITLIAAVLIAFGILVGIGFVWRELAFTTHTIVPATAPTSSAEVDVADSSVSDTTEKPSDTSNVPPAPPSPLAEPITVSVSDLPPTQRAVLETLGMDQASFTITPEMVTCAIEGVGTERVALIQKGDAPSIAEALTLVACMKK
jgi:cytoskeletal protein RodZ